MAKALIELAEELELLGWSVDMLSPDDLLPAELKGKPWNQVRWHYQEALKQYLQLHAAKYNVVEYDHSYLPYPRDEFSSDTLMVARSQLLVHHLETIQIPSPSISDLIRIHSWHTWKIKIRSFLKKHEDFRSRRKALENAQLTIHEADITIVLNQIDRSELLRQGISSERIYVIPNGLSAKFRALFHNISTDLPEEQRIVFIGTFDFRKGALDFPEIVRIIHDRIPSIKFRLIGTKGLYSHPKQVLALFPNYLRPHIEVIPAFQPKELPSLLSSCSIGVFPSYLEGFGLGVLEMLAASLPVIAYDAPGPPMMLPPDYLVAPGDTQGMSNKVVDLLQNPEKLKLARTWSKEQSLKFSWEQIARQTSQIYQKNWQMKQIKNEIQSVE